MITEEGGAPRIINAATKIGLTIYLVGSRATSRATVGSDFDYAIPGINSKKWQRIKNSLPGSKSRQHDLVNRIDLFKYLDETLPHLTFNPRNER